MTGFLKKEWPSLAVVVVLTLVMQALDYFGWLAGPEGRITDWFLRSGKAQAAENPVSVVEIDDAAYDACFDATSPLYAKTVTGLVTGAAAAKPWVIGVDILTEAGVRAKEYQAFAAKLPALQSKVIWISGAEKAAFEIAAFPAWLFGREDEFIVKPTPVLGYEAGELNEHPEIQWGVPVFAPDDDAGLRRFPRQIQLSADPQKSEFRESRRSWARLVAEEYCRSGVPCADESAEEVLLSYAASAPREFRMLDLFACSADNEVKPGGPLWDKFQEAARDKIVLIGGTFRSSGDFHQTPAGRLPGLIINAYAVQAEMHAWGVHEARRPMAVLFDLLIGILVVLLLPAIEWWEPKLPHHSALRRNLEENKIRWMMGASGALILGAIVVTWMLFGRGYLLSFLGVAVGVALHQIVEVWKLNPKIEG